MLISVKSKLQPGMQLQPQQRDIIIAAMTAVAIAIHVIESSLPSFLPGIKPGLANVISLICFFSFGFKTALQISLLRVFISSLIIGSFMSPAFVLSFSGALCSLFGLWLSSFIVSTDGSGRQWLGPIGVAVMASVLHMCGQFLTAWKLYLPHPQLFHLLPLLIMVSIITGLLSGMLTLAALKNKQIKRLLTRAAPDQC